MIIILLANDPVAYLCRCTPSNKQMLPTHKRRQIPRKMFGCVCDIILRSHALHRTERFYEISEFRADAISIDSSTFNCSGEDGIDCDASMTNFLRRPRPRIGARLCCRRIVRALVLEKPCCSNQGR